MPRSGWRAPASCRRSGRPRWIPCLTTKLWPAGSGTRTRAGGRPTTKMPLSPSHAAEPGSTETLCGVSTARMEVIGPWGTRMGGKCYECPGARSPRQLSPAGSVVSPSMPAWPGFPASSGATQGRRTAVLTAVSTAVRRIWTDLGSGVERNPRLRQPDGNLCGPAAGTRRVVGSSPTGGARERPDLRSCVFASQAVRRCDAGRSPHAGDASFGRWAHAQAVTDTGDRPAADHAGTRGTGLQ